MENRPFVFGKAASGENFTDREKEAIRLQSNFRNGVNTILISPRRWGKTSLVKKVGKLVESDRLKVVYIDIFACRSEADFYKSFVEAVLKHKEMSALELKLEYSPDAPLAPNTPLDTWQPADPLKRIPMPAFCQKNGISP